MLAADVGQFLQMVHIGQVGTESLHGLIITPLRMKAALPIVPENTIQLCNQCLVNADLLNLDPHMKRFLLCSEMPNRRSTPVGTNIPFPDDLRRNRKRSLEETLLYQHLGTLFRSLSLFMKLAV